MNEISTGIRKARTDEDRAAVSELVWEFMDLMFERYPEMANEIRKYIEHQNIAGQLADFDAFFLPPAGECFLAYHEGRAVGIVMIRSRKAHDAELNRMYVRPEGRGLGIGRRLCQAAIDEASRLGYQTLVLEALYRHTEALPLYRSLGFVQWDDPDGFDGNDKRVVSMKIDLTRADTTAD